MSWNSRLTATNILLLVVILLSFAYSPSVNAQCELPSYADQAIETILNAGISGLAYEHQDSFRQTAEWYQNADNVTHSGRAVGGTLQSVINALDSVDGSEWSAIGIELDYPR